MISKKKRDEMAESEKEMLLNPGKLKRDRRKKRKKRVLTMLCELAAIVVIIFALLQIIKAVGKNSLLSQAESASPELSLVQAKEMELTEEEEKRWQEGWVKYNGKIYAYNQDIMTFLIMGIDKKSDVKEEKEGTNGGQADALFLAVMNPHNKTISVVGINRNTMTDIDIYNDEGAYVTTTKAQIAVQHGFGNGMEESCEYQLKAVKNLFYNLPIHGYAAINMSAIPVINDAVGGVEVQVLQDLTAKDPVLIKGQRVHLMGDSAYVYIRERDVKEFASADLRLERQKQYLSAFIKTAKKAAKKDISVVLDLYKAVSAQMVTDISLNEAAYLASVLTNYQFTDEEFYMTDGETVMGEEFEEFYIDENSLYELILNIFYEEVENISA